MYSVFNGVLSDMLNDLLARFPGNAQIKSIMAFHSLASVGNEKAPYDAFVEHVMLPHGKMLESHDEAFFLEKDYATTPGSGGAAIIDSLKALWTHMTESDKQGVFGYIDLLISVHRTIQA